MKKAILISVFAFISATSFAQKAKPQPKTDTIPPLVIPGELAVKLYNAIQIAAKAIPNSNDIKASEATYALPVLQDVYQLIVKQYANKPKTTSSK